MDESSPTVKKASIIGLGNVCEGDFGIGCYIVDALWQECLGEAIDLAYLGHDPRDADLWLYKIDFAVIVGAVCLGGPAGHIYCWDRETFQRNIGWFAFTSHSIESLVNALARAEIAGGLPGDMLFLWLEAKEVSGLGISKELRKALRKAAQIIKQHLFERRFLPETTLRISPIYRLDLLRIVA